MKTYAQLAAAFIATVDGCALPEGDTPATFDCETEGDVCSYVLIKFDENGDWVDTWEGNGVTFCAPADADLTTTTNIISAIKPEANSWTDPIIFDQAVANMLDGTEPGCSEEVSNCMIDEAYCVKSTVISVPTEGDGTYTAYQTLLESVPDLVEGSVSYDCMLSGYITYGLDAFHASLETN